jgi:hypothetical protein
MYIPYSSDMRRVSVQIHIGEHTHTHTHARTHTHTEEYIHVPAINGECKAYFFDFFLVRNHVGDLLL